MKKFKVTIHGTIRTCHSDISAITSESAMEEAIRVHVLSNQDGELIRIECGEIQNESAVKCEEATLKCYKVEILDVDGRYTSVYVEATDLDNALEVVYEELNTDCAKVYSVSCTFNPHCAIFKGVYS